MAGTDDITLLIGHPDPAPERFLRALAAAYADGARAAGRTVRVFDLAALDFPLLRTKADFEGPDAASADVAALQDAILAGGHVVVFYPLWMGDMPALLKGLLEQTFRGPLLPDASSGSRLKGKSARVVVTMGMPALIYRLWFGAFGLRMLERSILRFAGFGPVRHTVIGRVEALGDDGRAKVLETMHALGREGR